MSRLRKSIWVPGVVLILAAVLVLVLLDPGWWPARSAVKRLAHEKTRFAALDELIASNQITWVPPRILDPTGTVVRYLPVKDAQGNWFCLFEINEGSGTFSFVFNKSGKCLLASYGGGWPPGRELGYFTDEGKIEKVLSFTEPLPDDRGFRERLQIYRLQPATAKLLLDIAYRVFPPDGGEAVMFPNWTVQPQGKRVSIFSLDVMGHPEQKVTIRWSADSQRYVVEGDNTTGRWKVLYPEQISPGGQSPNEDPQ